MQTSKQNIIEEITSFANKFKGQVYSRVTDCPNFVTIIFEHTTQITDFTELLRKDKQWYVCYTGDNTYKLRIQDIRIEFYIIARQSAPKVDIKSVDKTVKDIKFPMDLISSTDAEIDEAIKDFEAAKHIEPVEDVKDIKVVEDVKLVYNNETSNYEIIFEKITIKGLNPMQKSFNLNIKFDITN